MTAKFDKYSKCCVKWVKILINEEITCDWAMELYGCSFQAPHYLTWTQTNGNMPCSLI